MRTGAMRFGDASEATALPAFFGITARNSYNATRHKPSG
jgi:hypothetical protein